MIKRILVGLGGTGFTTVAIRRAVELAQIHDAQLTGVTVVDVERLRRVGSGSGRCRGGSTRSARTSPASDPGAG